MNMSGGSLKRAKSFNWVSAMLLTLWVVLVSITVESLGGRGSIEMQPRENRITVEAEELSAATGTGALAGYGAGEVIDERSSNLGG